MSSLEYSCVYTVYTGSTKISANEQGCQGFPVLSLLRLVPNGLGSGDKGMFGELW